MGSLIWRRLSLIISKDYYLSTYLPFFYVQMFLVITCIFGKLQQKEGCPNLAENLGLARGMFEGFFLQPSIEIGPMTT